MSIVSSTGLAQSGPTTNEPSIVELRDIELYASDDALQLKQIANSSQINAESARLRVGLMFNEERDNVLSVGAAMNTRPGLVPGVTVTIAARAYAALLAIENADVFALAPGLEVAYDYPLDRFPLHLSAGVY